MNSEELRRTMEFIAQQQALAWTTIQSLEEIVRQHSVQIAQHSAQIEQLGSRVSEVTDLLLRTGRIVEELDRRTEEKFQRTDERINALISLAERYFSDGRR